MSSIGQTLREGTGYNSHVHSTEQRPGLRPTKYSTNMEVGFNHEVFQIFYKRWQVMKELSDHLIAIDTIVGDLISILGPRNSHHNSGLPLSSLKWHQVGPPGLAALVDQE